MLLLVPQFAEQKYHNVNALIFYFAEMKELAKIFSFFGQYKTLIEDLIEHFRYGNGSNFHSQQLNLSFHEKINKYGYNSPIRIIKECIENGIN